SAIAIEPSWALSIRKKATRLAPESTTAMLSAQPRFSVSATAAWIAACAFAAEIGAPYGLAHGILSGMASRLGGAGGCWALAAPTRSQAAPMAAVKRRIFMESSPNSITPARHSTGVRMVADRGRHCEEAGGRRSNPRASHVALDCFGAARLAMT